MEGGAAYQGGVVMAGFAGWRAFGHSPSRACLLHNAVPPSRKVSNLFKQLPWTSLGYLRE